MTHSLRICDAALWKAVYGPLCLLQQINVLLLSATLFVKRKEFLPGSGFLSSRNITSAVESDVNTHKK